MTSSRRPPGAGGRGGAGAPVPPGRPAARGAWPGAAGPRREWPCGSSAGSPRAPADSVATRAADLQAGGELDLLDRRLVERVSHRHHQRRRLPTLSSAKGNSSCCLAEARAQPGAPPPSPPAPGSDPPRAAPAPRSAPAPAWASVIAPWLHQRHAQPLPGLRCACEPRLELRRRDRSPLQEQLADPLPRHAAALTTAHRGTQAADRGTTLVPRRPGSSLSATGIDANFL